MSRHRIVRSMNYSDEYDGYEDVYGHSVEDDYSMSPSDAAFMYDRNSRQPAQISAYLTTEDDILEEDETDASAASGGREGKGRKDSFVRPQLSDMDEARFRSCRDEVQSIIGDTVAESVLDEAILRSDFDVTRTLNEILNSPQKETVKRDDTSQVPWKGNTQQKEKDYASTIFNFEFYKSNDKPVREKSVGATDNMIKRTVSLSSSCSSSPASDALSDVVLSKSNICNGIDLPKVENRCNPFQNSPVSSPTSFSSLKALVMKHKRNNSESKEKQSENNGKLENLGGPMLQLDKDIKVLKEPCQTTKENINASISKSDAFCDDLQSNSGDSNSRLELQNSLSDKELSSGKGVASERTSLSVGYPPGRSSSLSALAKRCRNYVNTSVSAVDKNQSAHFPKVSQSRSNEKPDDFLDELCKAFKNESSLSQSKLDNLSVKTMFGEDYLSKSLPGNISVPVMGDLNLEFSSLGVLNDLEKSMGESMRNLDKISFARDGRNRKYDETDSVEQNSFAIDLMNALHSPVKEEDKIVNTVLNNLKVETEIKIKTKNLSPVKSSFDKSFIANDFENILKVKNESRSKKSSSFGKIVCKRYLDSDKKPCMSKIEIFETNIKPFTFNVLSPDDKILKNLLRK